MTYSLVKKILRLLCVALITVSVAPAWAAGQSASAETKPPLLQIAPAQHPAKQKIPMELPSEEPPSTEETQAEKTSTEEHTAETYEPDPIINSLEPLEPPETNPPKREPVVAPVDPCLPPLYRDWSEVSDLIAEKGEHSQFIGARIIIDVQIFHLTLEGILPDGTPAVIYETEVGIGEPQSPTPLGDYVINHVYCYPDVVYFSRSSGKVPGLYSGFLAPLMRCGKNGRCRRYRGIGIHGFDPEAHPHPAALIHSTYGQVSAGCIRLPDPCAFKSALVQTVGLGRVRHNERGTYHWLKTPIDVSVIDPEPVLVSIVRDGLSYLSSGIQNLLGPETDY